MSDEKVKAEIHDETEYRAAVVKTRETGIKEIVKAHFGGFHRTFDGRFHIGEDGNLTIYFGMNVGRYEEGVKALGFTVIIPLRDEEKELIPDEKEIKNVEDKVEQKPAEGNDPTSN